MFIKLYKKVFDIIVYLQFLPSKGGVVPTPIDTLAIKLLESLPGPKNPLFLAWSAMTWKFMLYFEGSKLIAGLLSVKVLTSLSLQFLVF